MRSYRQKTLLCTAALLAPVLLAGCADSMGSFAEEQQSAFSGKDAHQLGVHHFQQGHYGLAVQHFERAMDRNPASVETLNGLGAAYDQLGRFDLAERSYRRALRMDPQSAQTLNNMGYSFWLQGKHDLALAYLRDADQLDRGSRLIAANKALASASLREVVAKTDEQEAVVPAKVSQVAVTQDGGARIERASTNEQVLLIKSAPVPAAFDGMPQSTDVTANAFETAGSALSLDYLPSSEGEQITAEKAETPTVASKMPSSQSLEGLERNQMAAVPVYEVEEVALAPLPIVEVSATENTATIVTDNSDEVLDVVAVESVSSRETQTDSEAAPLLFAAAPVAEETPAFEEAYDSGEDDREISGFLASLVDGLKNFFASDQAQVASGDAYVGPYGTETGGRHHMLGRAQSDQYARTATALETSFLRDIGGAESRVASQQEGTDASYSFRLDADLTNLLSNNQVLTSHYYAYGWNVQSSGLVAKAPSEVRLDAGRQQDVDREFDVRGVGSGIDHDLTAEHAKGLDESSG